MGNLNPSKDVSLEIGLQISMELKIIHGKISKKFGARNSDQCNLASTGAAVGTGTAADLPSSDRT